MSNESSVSIHEEVPVFQIPNGVPPQLAEAARQVKAGRQQFVTVRTLLGWFDAARRRKWVVARVRQALKLMNLTTFPDFEGEWLDSEINLVDCAKFSQPLTVTTTTTPPPPVSPFSVSDTPSVTAPVDPSHRLGRLKAANTRPVSVKAEEPVERATTLMLTHDFSQLPVMSNEREVKGMISWKSIGSRMVLGSQCKTVRDCMESHTELTEDASIFEALARVADHDCVLVRRHDRVISGIVSATDINEQFKQLAEPFLLIADIETRLRALIEPKFTIAELQAAKDPEDKDRAIESVSDLSLGECIRLLASGERWPELKLKLDRGEFISRLDKIRDTRNDVMHFDPDGVSEESLNVLRAFSGFLGKLQRMTST